MTYKNPTTSILIPVWQIFATALLLYLLPQSQIVERFLLSYLIYKWQLSVVKMLFLLIVFLFPFWLHQRAMTPLNKKRRDSLLKEIKKDVIKQYKVHKKHIKVERGKNNFSTLMPKSFYEYWFYKNDIKTFSRIIEDVISEKTTNINSKYMYKYLSQTIRDLFLFHNSDIKNLYNIFVDETYKDKNIEEIEEIKNHFVLNMDSETNTQIELLTSEDRLNEFL